LAPAIKPGGARDVSVLQRCHAIFRGLAVDEKRLPKFFGALIGSASDGPLSASTVHRADIQFFRL